MENKVHIYINSLLPKNISKKKREELYLEYQDHIFEKIDLYIDVGYDKETAVNKAISEMGSEEDVKRSINSSFENLYKERTFVAVIIGIIPFLINFLMLIFGVWITSADYLGKPDYVNVVLSLWAIFFIVYLMVACYFKGMRKSLIAVAVSLFAVFLNGLWCMFSQCGLYGILTVGSYLLDRFTPIITRDVDFSGIIYIVSIVFTFLLSVASFALSFVLKKRGMPNKKHQKSIGIVFVSVLLVCFLFVLPYNKATEYYSTYPVWFQETGDKICEEEKEIYNSITNETSFDEAVKVLNDKGYTNVEEYMADLGKNTEKKLRYNIEKLNLNLDDGMVIFFNEAYIEGKISQFKDDGNRLVFLKKGSDGKVCEKAIGYLSYTKDEYGGYGVYGSRRDDYKKCLNDFSYIKIGDSKESVISKYGTEYGEPYTMITKYTQTGCEEYFRFYVNGYKDDDIYDTSIYAEFIFVNSVLASGNLYYDDISEEEIKEIMLSVK